MHYTDYSDETIHKLQELELMILKDFIAICEENNIEYFIYGGSAIRCRQTWRFYSMG